MSALWPVFLRFAGRRVLVVGGGIVALGKARALVQAGAEVVVVAPEVHPELRQAGAHAVVERAVVEADLDQAWFVVAAATPAVNRAVAAWAEPRHLFVLAVDDKAATSAYGAAVLERDGITFAIGSSGRAPALVALLRAGLDALLPADLDAWVALAESLRPRWREGGVPMAERVPRLLAELNRLYARKVA